MKNAIRNQGKRALHEEGQPALSGPGSLQDLERPPQPIFAQQGQHITLDRLQAEMRLGADKHGTGIRFVDASAQCISILDSNKCIIRAQGTAGSASLRGSNQEVVAGFSGELAWLQGSDTLSDQQVQRWLCLPAGGGDIVLSADVKDRLVRMEQLALRGATALLQKEAHSLDATYGNRIVVEVEVGVHRSRDDNVRSIAAKGKGDLYVKRAGEASFVRCRGTHDYESCKVLDFTDMPLYAFLLERFGDRFRNAAVTLEAMDRIRYGDVVRLKAMDPLKPNHARCLAMHAHLLYWHQAPASNGGLASRVDEWVVRPAGRPSDTREPLPANAAFILESVARRHFCIGFHSSWFDPRWQVQACDDGSRAWVALAPVEGDDCNGLIYNGQKVWLRRHDQREPEYYCAAHDAEDAVLGSGLLMALHGIDDYGKTQGVIARKERCSDSSKVWQAQWVLERVRK